MVLAVTVTGTPGCPLLSFSMIWTVGRLVAISRASGREAGIGRRYSMLDPRNVLPDAACVATTFPVANMRSSRAK